MILLVVKARSTIHIHHGLMGKDEELAIALRGKPFSGLQRNKYEKSLVQVSSRTKEIKGERFLR